MEPLPEFRVTLTRVQPGESPYPPDAEKGRRYLLGQRTKLGGLPDRIQPGMPLPHCGLCGQEYTFVAQIDSIEHDSPENPHSVDARSDEQRWMFSDVGMLYVFFCFDCGQPDVMLEYY